MHGSFKCPFAGVAFWREKKTLSRYLNFHAVSEQGPLHNSLIESLQMDGRACDKVPLTGPVWLAASRKPDSRALIQRDSEAQKCHQVSWQRTHARFVSQLAVDEGLQEHEPLHSSPSGNQSTPCLILSKKPSSRWSGEVEDFE